MTRPRHDWSRVFSATFFEALSIGVGIGLQMFLMRRLGVSQYGLYAYGCALGFFAYALVDFGFSYAGVRRAVALARQADKLRSLFFAVQTAKALTWATVVAIAIGSFFALPGTVPALSPILLGATGAWLNPAWFVSGRNGVVEVARAWLLARTACAATVLLVVKGPDQATAAMVLTLASPLIATTILYRDPEVLRLLAGPWPGLPWPGVRAALRSGSAALPVSIFPTLAPAALQTVILSVGTTSVLGLFSAADRVRSAVQGIYQALSSNAFPGSVGSLMDNAQGTRRLLTRLVRLAIIVPAMMAVVTYLLAGPIVEFVMGTAYAGAVSTLRVLCFAFVPSALALFLVTQIMVPLSREWDCIVSATLGLTLQCALLAWLVPEHGPVGAAASFVLGEVFAVGLLMIFVRRHWYAIN